MSGGSDNPWLSVLMPIFNGAGTLESTLNSIVDQADGIEFILVDQGSSDGSLEIAEAFADRIDTVLVSAPENRNWVQNTNKALGLARAPRAALLHQDDLWRPGRAALLRAMFDAAPDAALWLHGADYVDDEGRCIGEMSPPFGTGPRTIAPDEALASLIVQNTVALPAAAFPVGLVREIGGLDETLWYTADWNLWLELAQRGPTHWHPEKAAAFRLHGGSLTLSGSRNLDDFAQQLATPIERHRSALPATAEAQAVRLGELSNLLNVWLASVFHGSRRALWPVIAGYLALGPHGWVSFPRQSRILARVLPRLKLRTGRKAVRHG